MFNTWMSVEIDPILEMLIKLVESRAKDQKPCPQVKIMVTIGSMFVTGIVVSEDAFMSQEKPMLKLLKGAKQDGIMETAIELNKTITDIECLHPQFLHLAKVSFSDIAGNCDPPEESSEDFWRVKLSRIDGLVLSGSFNL